MADRDQHKEHGIFVDMQVLMGLDFSALQVSLSFMQIICPESGKLSIAQTTMPNPQDQFRGIGPTSARPSAAGFLFGNIVLVTLMWKAGCLLVTLFLHVFIMSRKSGLDPKP